MGGTDDMWAMMFWMLLWGLVSLVVVVLAAVGVVAVVRGRRGDQSALTRGSAQVDASAADPAVQELRRRLAAGEIDEDEYLRRRAALQ
jgi:putative membrane protein